jgi:hypothetical protein
MQHCVDVRGVEAIEIIGRCLQESVAQGSQSGVKSRDTERTRDVSWLDSPP